MKQIVLSQTCQGEAMRYLLSLSEPLGRDYTCTFVPNFEIVDGVGKMAPPVALEQSLPTCDVLIYHDVASYDFGALIRKMPSGSQAIRIPFVTSTIYWPSHDYKNPIWLLPYQGQAYGIPWPCRLLSGLIVKLRDKQRILQAYLDLDLPSQVDCAANFAEQIRYLEQAEAGTIFSVSAFVRDNFARLPLFHLINHPTTHTFLYLANTLLDHLGYPPLTVQPVDSFAHHQMPVHPSLIRHYDLRWCDPTGRISLFEREVSFEEYVSIYIDEYIEKFSYTPYPVAQRKRGLLRALSHRLGGLLRPLRLARG